MSPYTGVFAKRPQIITARKRSLGQGNVLTPVCDSVQRGCVADTPSRQTPLFRHPQADTPNADNPPLRQTPSGRPSRQTPPRQVPLPNQGDSHRSGRYAPYWNAFLLRIFHLLSNGTRDFYELVLRTNLRDLSQNRSKFNKFHKESFQSSQDDNF